VIGPRLIGDAALVSRTEPANRSTDGRSKVSAAWEAEPLRQAPLPARLVIPAIGVDAPVAPVGLESSGIMAAPTEGHVVGWYELGARPGERSNAVLTGHVDWHGQVAVFQRLRDLRTGDVVDVDTGLGAAFRYVVADVTTYPADTAPVAEIFGATSEAFLTLITCGGAFDAGRHEYLDRVVVRAHAG
jgi:LPXTG-site transpeptidase (sortase) family protein